MDIHVTNRLDTVTGDVPRDIQIITAARVYSYCIQIYNTHVLNKIFYNEIHEPIGNPC